MSSRAGRAPITAGWCCAGFGLLLLIPPIPPLVGLGILVTGVGYLLGGYSIRRWAHRQDVRDAQRVSQVGRSDAMVLQHRLLAGNPPPPVALLNPTLRPGESAVLSVPATVRRWRRYFIPPRARVPWYLSSDLWLATVGVLDDLAADRPATALSTPAWRDPYTSTVVLTSTRLLWSDQDGWTTIPLADIVSCQHAEQRLELAASAVAPVRFDGPRVTSLAIYLDWLLRHDAALQREPSRW